MSRGAVRGAVGLALVALSVATARAETLRGTPAGPADPKAALDAYAACVTKPAGPNCPAIRSRVVAMVADNFRQLATAPNRRFVSLFVAGLKAREPEIRAVAAESLAMAGPTAADTSALLIAVNDPVPAVREAAVGALSVSKDTAAAAAVARYVKPKNSKSLSPQKGPDATWLGAKPFPGTTYSFASSDSTEHRWEYLTAEPAAMVVAFYKTGAKKGPLVAAELRKAYAGKSVEEQMKADAESVGIDTAGGSDDSGTPSADQMAKAMAMAQKMTERLQQDTAGKSPEEAQKALLKGAAAQGTPLPIEKFENTEAYGSPQFLVLEEGTYLGSVRPLTYVVVYQDKAFGKTGIAILKAPE